MKLLKINTNAVHKFKNKLNYIFYTFIIIILFVIDTTNSVQRSFENSVQIQSIV